MRVRPNGICYQKLHAIVSGNTIRSRTEVFRGQANAITVVIGALDNLISRVLCSLTDGGYRDLVLAATQHVGPQAEGCDASPGRWSNGPNLRYKWSKVIQEIIFVWFFCGRSPQFRRRPQQLVAAVVITVATCHYAGRVAKGGVWIRLQPSPGLLRCSHTFPGIDSVKGLV